MSLMFRGYAAWAYSAVAGELFFFNDLYRAVTENILKKTRSGGVILDVGTGPAHLLVQIAKQSSSSLLGIDVSRDMMRLSKANTLGAENVQLFVGDVTRIPLKNQSVNLAIALLSYHH